MVLELKTIQGENSSVDNSKVRDVLESFGQNLTISLNPFQDINNYRVAESNLKKLRKKLEDICKSNPRELDKICADYHKPALKLLGYAVRTFYILRESQASRELDRCAGFAKLLKVSNLDYINVVLENTPIDYMQQELEDQLKEKGLSQEELKKLLDKYNLKEPKSLDTEQDNPEKKPDKKSLYRLLRDYFAK